MTLPASFPLSMSQIATEFGESLPKSLRDANVRELAGTGSGPISFSDLFGLSALPTGFNGLTTGGGTSLSDVPFSTASSARQVICVIHFRTASSSGVLGLESATIGSVNATIRAQAQSNFSGGGGQSQAVLVGIISASVPTGASGTVSVNISNDTGTNNISVGSWSTYRPLSSVDALGASSLGATEAEIPLEVPSDGVAIVAATNNTTGVSLEITGLNGGSEVYDSGNSNLRAVAVWGSGLSALSDTVTATQGAGSNGMAIAGMAWQPG